MTKTATGFGTLLILLAMAMAITAALGTQAFFAAVPAPAPQLSDHAVQVHGAAAIEINSTLNCNGSNDVWYRPSDDRYAFICKLVNGKWGVQVDEAPEDETAPCGSNVTCFLNKAKDIYEVYEYLAKSGYVRP